MLSLQWVEGARCVGEEKEEDERGKKKGKKIKI